MRYFVVYKSKVMRRVTKDGVEQHYVSVGIHYGVENIVNAIQFTEHLTEDDAAGAWEAHCYRMKKEWPRRAGMDVAELQKHDEVSNGTLIIDGSYQKIEVDRNVLPPKLF